MKTKMNDVTEQRSKRGWRYSLLIMSGMLAMNYATAQNSFWTGPLPGAQFPNSQITRTGNTAFGNVNTHFGVGNLEATHDSKSMWTSFMGNGNGKGRVLRLKGGWKNDKTNSVFQIEPTSELYTTEENIRFVVKSNGNTGIGISMPEYRLHVKDITASDQGPCDKHVAFMEGASTWSVLKVLHTGSPDYDERFRAAVYGVWVEDVSWGGMFHGGHVGVSGIGHRGEVIRGVRGDAYAQIDVTQSVTGVYGIAHDYPFVADGGQYIGVHGVTFAKVLEGQSGAAYGVLGEVSLQNAGSAGTNGMFAGYFNGDIGGVGTMWYASDMRFKENIKSLDHPLEKLKLIASHSYTFKQSEELSNFSFSRGTKFGFLAQEVEKVFPELVKTNIHPARYDEEGKKIADQQEYKAVDYVGFIPVLAASIQEQQTQIEEKNDRIEALEFRIGQLEMMLDKESSNKRTNLDLAGEIKLYQNNPNPAKENTTISYAVPTGVNHAIICIYDLTGKQIKRIDLSQKGNASVEIKSGELSAGTYIYTLICDEQVIDSKKMILLSR